MARKHRVSQKRLALREFEMGATHTGCSETLIAGGFASSIGIGDGFTRFAIKKAVAANSAVRIAFCVGLQLLRISVLTAHFFQLILGLVHLLVGFLYALHLDLLCLFATEISGHFKITVETDFWE